MQELFEATQNFYISSSVWIIIIIIIIKLYIYIYLMVRSNKFKVKNKVRSFDPDLKGIEILIRTQSAGTN